MTPEIRSRIGRSGASNGNFKGGWRDEYGYVHIGDVLRSHIVWNETHPDDPIRRDEVIHHANHVKDDDRPENLTKFASQSDHWKQHVAAVTARRKRDEKGMFLPNP
jgi:hypothetical protein